MIPHQCAVTVARIESGKNHSIRNKNEMKNEKQKQKHFTSSPFNSLVKERRINSPTRARTIELISFIDLLIKSN